MIEFKMKTDKKRIIKYILLALLIILVLLTIIVILNPLRRTEKNIRKKLLESTPVGTEMEEVIEYIESRNKCEIQYISDTHGYYVHNGSPSEYSKYGIKIGDQSVRIYLGDYYNPFCVSVIAFYGFDSDGKLVDISVRKDIDSL